MLWSPGLSASMCACEMRLSALYSTTYSEGGGGSTVNGGTNGTQTFM